MAQIIDDRDYDNDFQNNDSGSNFRNSDWDNGRIRNSTVGDRGGREFTALQAGAQVREVEYWNKVESGRTVFKCLKITWSNGQTQYIGDPSGSSAGFFKLGSDEKVSEWHLYYSRFVQGIFYKSNRVPGGTNIGNANAGWSTDSCGNGKLLGFHGTYGDDLKSLGAIWELR